MGKDDEKVHLLVEDLLQPHDLPLEVNLPEPALDIRRIRFSIGEGGGTIAAVDVVVIKDTHHGGQPPVGRLPDPVRLLGHGNVETVDLGHLLRDFHGYLGHRQFSRFQRASLESQKTIN